MNRINAYDTRILRLSGNGELHVHVREGRKMVGTVIFVHGFIGNGIENHRLFIRLADVFVGLGYRAILFDQYGSGYSDGEHQDVSMSTCREDLRTVIQWAEQEFGMPYGLVGQSAGSAIVLEMTGNQNEECIFRVMLNPAAGFDTWLLSRFGWDLNSDEPVLCARPKGVMVSRTYIEELLVWDWLGVLGKSSIPTLIVASGDDELKSDEVAREAAERLGQTASVKFVPRANHTYTCQPCAERSMHEIVRSWVGRCASEWEI